MSLLIKELILVGVGLIAVSVQAQLLPTWETDIVLRLQHSTPLEASNPGRLCVLAEFQ